MQQKILFFALVFLLSSCNSTEEKLKLVLDSYLGYKQTALVQNFGQTTKAFYNGSDKVLEYEFVEHHFDISPNNTSTSLNTPSASGNITPNGSGGLNFNYKDLQGSYSTSECKLAFTVNRLDQVKDWHYSGNACARYATKENVNRQYIVDLPKIMDKTYGFDFQKSSKGFRVKTINPLSSAYQAGLKANDTITKINGLDMRNNPIEIGEHELEKNSQAKLSVERGSERLELLVKKAEIGRLYLYKKSLRKFLGFKA